LDCADRFVLNKGRIGFVVATGLIEFRDIRMEPVPQKSERPSFPGVLRPGDGVSPPILLQQVKPAYTEDAMRVGAEGDIWLECVVLADGTVDDVSVVRPLHPSLDKNAVAAAKQWRFKAGTRNGEPVVVLVTISMSFTLKQ
jgi:TonB family protein